MESTFSQITTSALKWKELQVLYVHKNSASLFALTEDIQTSDILNVISKLESNKSLRFNCVLRDLKKVISKVPFR